MYKTLKRLLDILISATVLILISPILLIIILLLRFTGEGEIFYLQKRIGFKNAYFNIIKFATMLKNSPNIGTGSITLRNDPRVTRVGSFLRITKINEIPQIINVLKGDMSIVGPRPLVDRTFNAYSDSVQACIYDSKPGITGIGSIVFRDEESLISNSSQEPHVYYEQVIAPYKGALEMWYQQKKSLFLDIQLLFLTAWVIVFPNSKLPYSMFTDLPKRPVNL